MSTIEIIRDYKGGRKIYEIKTEEEESDKIRIALLLRKIDRLERKRREEEKRRICPHCHMVIPTNGICDECGYRLG